MTSAEIFTAWGSVRQQVPFGITQRRRGQLSLSSIFQNGIGGNFRGKLADPEYERALKIINARPMWKDFRGRECSVFENKNHVWRDFLALIHKHVSLFTLPYWVIADQNAASLTFHLLSLTWDPEVMMRGLSVLTNGEYELLWHITELAEKLI